MNKNFLMLSVLSLITFNANAETISGYDIRNEFETTGVEVSGIPPFLQSGLVLLAKDSLQNNGDGAIARTISGATHSTFARETTFDLNGFKLVDNTGSQTLTINGYINNSLVNSSNVSIDSVSITNFVANWQGITSFEIINNDINGLFSPADFWGLNDIIINEPIPTVPEPQGYAMLLAGLGLVACCRKNHMAKSV